MKFPFFIVIFFIFFYNGIGIAETNSMSTNMINENINNADKIFYEGLNKAKEGKTTEAIKLLESLLQYNTDNISYYLYLGYLEYVAGNYDKAKDVLLKSLNINGNLVISHLILGEIYYELNDIIKAREEFEKVVSINDNVKIAHIRLYELYKNNNPVIANKHYIKIFQLPPTKIEQFLPDIKKIGSLNLNKNNEKILLKDIGIDKKIKKIDKVTIANILNENEEKTNKKEEVIVKVKKNKFKFNISFDLLSAPFKNFDLSKFYVKLVEFIIITIFLIIYNIIKNRREKSLNNVVLNHFRITRYSNKES